MLWVPTTGNFLALWFLIKLCWKYQRRGQMHLEYMKGENSHCKAHRAFNNCSFNRVINLSVCRSKMNWLFLTLFTKVLLHLAINVVFMVSNITILWYHDCYRANIFPTVIENRWSCTNFSDSGNTMSPGKIKICLCVIFMMWSFHLHNVNLYVTQY